MAVLTSGLETFDYGTQGWSAIEETNLELLDNKLVSVMTATKILGEEPLADIIATATDPSAQTSATLTDSSGGTATTTIADVGASYSQTGLNDIHASLVAQINALQAEMAESRTREAEYKNAIDNLKTGINALLALLRKTGGCGVLADNPA